MLAWGQPVGLPADLLSEVRRHQLLPSGRYVFVQAWEAETAFAHKMGRQVVDEQASGKAAWEVRVGTDKPNDYALFGPYADLPAGNYVAFFRLKLLDQPIRDIVAELDACLDYGRRILSADGVCDVDLVPSKFVQVPLPFRYDGGKLECRLFWCGVLSLWVDKVTLFRVDGAPPEQFVKRAPRG